MGFLSSAMKKADRLQVRLSKETQFRVKILIALVLALGTACGIAAANRIFWRCKNLLVEAQANGLYSDALWESCYKSYARDQVTDILKVVSSACAGIAIILILYRCAHEFSVMQIKKTLLPGQTFWNTLIPFTMVQEIIIAAIHCPIGVYTFVRFEALEIISAPVIYDLDSFLSLGMILRVYFLIPIAAEILGLQSATAKVISAFNGIEFDTSLVFRAMMNHRPLATVLSFFSITVIIESYAMYVAERPVCYTSTAFANGWCNLNSFGKNDFSSYSISVWNILVTSITIGYGDVYALTQLGRTIAIMTGMIGCITTALLITGISRAVALTKEEERAYNAFLRLQFRSDLRTKAKRVIQAFIIYWAYRRGTLPKNRIKVAVSTKDNSGSTVNNPLSGARTGASVGGPYRHVNLQYVAPSHVFYLLLRNLKAWITIKSHTKFILCESDASIITQNFEEMKRVHSDSSLRSGATLDRVVRIVAHISRQADELRKVVPTVLSAVEHITPTTAVTTASKFSTSSSEDLKSKLRSHVSDLKIFEDDERLNEVPNIKDPIDLAAYELTIRGMERTVNLKKKIKAVMAGETKSGLHSTEETQSKVSKVLGFKR